MRPTAQAARIDVFDSAFAPVSLPGSFTDPNVPAGFVPFNVQDIGGKVYVTYAPAGLAAQRAATPGVGLVSIFDENGAFQQRLINGSQLAAPWALALAPAGFGPLGGSLLVGNFSFAEQRDQRIRSADGRVPRLDPDRRRRRQHARRARGA